MPRFIRPRRWLRLLALLIVYLVLGSTALVALALVAINLPPINRFAAREVTQALDGTFKGRVVLHRLGLIDFGGVIGAEAEVLDAAGRSVLTVRGADVRVFWPRLVWDSVFGGAGPTTIRLDEVGLEQVGVTLVDDGSGTPTLASAFEPAQPEAEPEAGPGTIFIIEQLIMEQAAIRGELKSPGPIDADLEQLEARLESRPESFHLAIEHLSLAARQLPGIGTLDGVLEADVTLPTAADTTQSASPDDPVSAPPDRPTTTVHALRPAPARRILASFNGELAGASASADLRMIGEQLRATFEAPAVSPATLTQLVPGLAPKDPAGVAASAEGALDDLRVSARVTQGQAELAARGRIERRSDTTHLEAHADLERLDLARLLPEAAPTELSFGADAKLALGPRGGAGTYELMAPNLRIGDERLPGARLRGEVSLPEREPVVTTGSLDIDEPGAPTQIQYRVHVGDSGTRASWTSNSRLNRPGRLAELASGLQVEGTLTTSGNFDGVGEQIDAIFDVELRQIEHPTVNVRRSSVSGYARGPLASPALEVSARLRGVSALGRELDSVRLLARGDPTQLNLRSLATGPDVGCLRARATLELGEELSVQNPEVTLDNQHGAVRIASERVDLQGGGIRVEGLTLEGPGRAELSLTYGQRLEALAAQTVDLNPARLLTILGIPSPLRHARVDLEAQFSGRGQVPSGKLAFAVEELAVGSLRGAEARAEFVLERGKLSGDASAALARGAKTYLSVEGLDAKLLSRGPDAWHDNGNITLTGDVDLKQLASVMPLPGIERAEGNVRFDVDLKATDDDPRPLLRAHVETDSLLIIGERPETSQTPSAEQARQTSPFWLRGVDFSLDAELGQQRANISGRVFDREGDLLRAEGNFREVALRQLAELPQALLRSPMNARVQIPPRKFEHFPAPVRPTEVSGVVSLAIDAEGTLAAPRLLARGRVRDFSPAGELSRAPTLDLELAAEYTETGGGLQLRAHDGRRARLDLTSRWSGNAAHLADAATAQSPLEGDLRLALDDFPVEVIPELESRHIRGELSGQATLTGLGREARFALDLTTEDLNIDRLSVDEVTTSVRADSGKLEVKAAVTGRAGELNAQFATGIDWDARLVPVVHESLEGSVRAREFRLSALLPLVEGSVSDLDGKLNAELDATIEAGVPRLSGQMTLREGVLHLPSIGQRFHGMTADVEVSPQMLRVSSFQARGVSGGLEAEAQARLEGLTPTGAELEVRIDDDHKLPLTVEGEAVGEGWGTITARYAHDEANKRNTLHVSLEEFNLELPRAPPRGIQDLSQPEHVRVGFHRRDGEFVAIPLQPVEEPSPPSEYETVVIVELGSLRVEKGEQAEVTLGGEVTAQLGAELDVEGKVETRRGELDISGKQFEIERGTVTFTGGAPDDPMISAVARYDSPAGYTVYAEYNGTVTEGKLRLRSEPALSQDEILTLLMFGTPEGSFGAGSGDSLSTAVSVAGGTAAQGLNRALSDVTDLDVSARVDTSTGAPRPELVLQITPRVTAKVTQAIGEPTPGQSPDRTFLTVELRIASAWSLSTMIGDRGASALDLIWRRRY